MRQGGRTGALLGQAWQEITACMAGMARCRGINGNKSQMLDCSKGMCHTNPSQLRLQTQQGSTREGQQHPRAHCVAMPQQVIRLHGGQPCLAHRKKLAMGTRLGETSGALRATLAASAACMNANIQTCFCTCMHSCLPTYLPAYLPTNCSSHIQRSKMSMHIHLYLPA